MVHHDQFYYYISQDCITSCNIAIIRAELFQVKLILLKTTIQFDLIPTRHLQVLTMAANI